ncbi:MAG: ABC transporter substrate-binding protein [Treponema sp.]|jgi:NitT/TauT family transport system substrate-binding protein|nr:ABC transporter substrate-binding protein [Treponema sp.]
MKKGRYFGLFVFSVMAIIAGTIGCRKPGDTESSEKFSNKLRIAIAGSETTFVSIANGQKYFSEAGIPIEFQNITNPGEALSAIELGRLDINTVALIPTLNFISNGSDLTIFGGIRSEGGELITTPNKKDNYKDITSLKGRKVGIIHLDTADYNTRKLLRGKGIDPNQDIEYIEFDSYLSIMEALKKGDLDYGITISEMARVGEEQGLVSVQKIADLVPFYVCCRQVAKTSSIRENRDEYVALLKAEIKGYKYLREKRGESKKYLAELSGQPEDYFETVIYSKTAPVFSPDPARDKIIDFYNLLKAEGVFPGEVSIEDHIDSSLFEDAITQLLAESPNDATYLALLREFEANNTTR